MSVVKSSLLTALVFASLAYGQRPEETGSIEKEVPPNDVPSSVMIRLC